ncbi:hypothetical protein GWI33_009828 [Rhynchophorus ferrugineus]|uniref:Uncharacterized protein n=1 Tax=Rhynchophorus ferrugineus TaxID=354439 RepID=A0A834MCN5_RHYFE|nr:hypothetical protein GWI33_009828 [Rhynchophorus ferrugineus]
MLSVGKGVQTGYWKRQEIFRRELGENHERIEGAVWKLGLAAAVFYRRPVAILTRPINKKIPVVLPPRPAARRNDNRKKNDVGRSSILVRHLNEGCFKRGDGVEGWRDEERLTVTATAAAAALCRTSVTKVAVPCPPRLAFPFVPFSAPPSYHRRMKRWYGLLSVR